MKFDAEVKREIYKIAIGCFICSLITVAVFLAIGKFDFTVITGGALGFISSFGNFFLMCVGVIRALDTGDAAAAKMKLRSSYIVRTIMQIGFIALALVLESYINWIPVAVAVFYPRITITVCNAWKILFRKEAPKESAPSSDASDGNDTEVKELPEDEEEQTDEFEKFVSGFYKGDKNTKK